MFNVSVVRYYTDQHESEIFPFIVTVLALSVTMFAVLLVPIDIYLADSGSVASTDLIRFIYFSELRGAHSASSTFYCDCFVAFSFRSLAISPVLYGCIMLFAFVLVPFAYFFYEEDDEDVTTKSRLVGACKYTVRKKEKKSKKKSKKRNCSFHGVYVSKTTVVSHRHHAHSVHYGCPLDWRPPQH